MSFTDVWNLLSDDKDYAIVALDLLELALMEIAVETDQKSIAEYLAAQVAGKIRRRVCSQMSNGICHR
jgi:hypothetical protein